MSRLAVIVDLPPADAAPDRQDDLEQVRAVEAALTRLGHASVQIGATADLDRLTAALEAHAVDGAFNLVESLDGDGSVIDLVPEHLERLGLPFTGAGSAALRRTSDKISAGSALAARGLAVPGRVDLETGEGFAAGERLIIKSRSEHASLGLDDASVACFSSLAEVRAAVEERAARFGGAWIAERYVEGREINVALLEGPRGPEPLPPSEVRFIDYPEGKPRIVSYDSKWTPGSFDYEHSPRRFLDPVEDADLIAALHAAAAEAWGTFGLRGYARVDFRVPREGAPVILEVNANPCLSADAGFSAALAEGGVEYDEAIRRVLAASGLGGW